MGRELRRITRGWQHPRDEHGQYVPLHDKAYSDALAEYEAERALWAQRQHPSQIEWPAETAHHSYEEWVGEPPDPRYYRTESWTHQETGQWVLYENVTEGTPVSPAFDTVNDLMAWMAANGYGPHEISRIARGWRLPTITAYAPRKEQDEEQEEEPNGHK
jgi:hypothetical protein